MSSSAIPAEAGTPVGPRISACGICSTMLASAFSLFLIGCGSQPTVTTSNLATVHAIAGSVHGGQQPVSGAVIQLYAVGTTGDGSAASPLLNQMETTDSQGSFSITGTFTCPQASTNVYLTAVGGNPGLGAGGQNAQIAMFAPLGACGQLNASTFVNINELTTVAGLAALYPYMTGYAALGFAAADQTQFQAALSTVAEFTDISTGSVPGPSLPSGYFASQQLLRTLADILSACVNSSGGVAGDGSPCGELFALATPTKGTAPTDTIGAAIQILNNPTANIPSLLTLIAPSAPFQPTLALAPTTLTPVIMPYAQPPSFSPGTGSYSAVQAVSISDSTPGASIFYTTDGSVPTASSTAYTGGTISVSSTESLNALAIATGYANSPVASAAYILTLPVTATPSLSLATGVYQTSQTLTISDATAAAVISYTLDGTDPATSFTAYTYTAPLPIVSSETVRAVAVAPGYLSSPSTSSTYTLQTPLITVSAAGGVAINPRIYGANNIWFYVPDTSFDKFSGSLQKNAGIGLMRFPGGYESEYYNWSNNTLDPSYSNYTATPGVTPAHILADMGANNVTFVVRTADALEANTASEYQTWATEAAGLVTQYGGQVQDWQIGNEWYNDSGAQTDHADYINRYAQVLTYFAPAMKAAAAAAGYKINIYASAVWSLPDDLTTMRNDAGPAVWADVDGLDIHVYTGINPRTAAQTAYPPLPISSIASTIAQLQANSGKSLVYVSEWMADLEDNYSYGGMEDANIMLQMMGQFAQAGITEAAYWPPVAEAPQAGKVTLVKNTSNYGVDADGQVMSWMSSNYLGNSVPVTVTNSSVNSIAAQNGSQVVVFIMGGSVSNETENIQVNGFSWKSIVSAQVLYATGTNVSSGPGIVANIPAAVVSAGGQNTAQFVINPGGSNRGSAWEIVKLVLQ